MASERRHIFYGDLNCPFCYAQNERLASLGLAHLVQWRGVEHLSELPTRAAPDVAHRRELQKELTRLRSRAPDVELVDPAIRPNTRLGIAVIAAAERIDPSKASVLRQRLYRALWREGRDISDPALVLELADAVGLPAPDHRRELPTVRRWTQEWARGEFDRRIPSMRSREGDVLLGMATPDALREFIWLRRSSDDPGATCASDD